MVIDTMSQKFQESVGTSYPTMFSLRVSVTESYVGGLRVTVPPADLVSIAGFPAYR